jgi:hypothetical protein
VKTAVTVRAAGAAQCQAALEQWLTTLRASGAAGSDRAAVVVAGALPTLTAPATVAIAHVVGCPCCTAQVALRVTLTRLLRSRRPAHLLLLQADGTHLDRIRNMLGSGPFADALHLIETRHGTHSD